MESPFLDFDIEAQTNNSVTGSLPEINIQSPSPTTHSANLQPELPSTSEPQPQPKNPDQHHHENAAARKATDNVGVQRGTLTFLFQFYKL
jgi:hypothetical protein